MDKQQDKPQIEGYRNLTPQEVAAINYVKQMANEVGATLDEMANFPGIDRRWLAIATTHLQMGFMFAVRSIAKPESF